MHLKKRYTIKPDFRNFIYQIYPYAEEYAVCEGSLNSVIGTPLIEKVPVRMYRLEKCYFGK